MTSDQFQLQFPIPEELLRIPDGSSVSEADAVLAENGRTSHGYKEGKYFLPNDPVCRIAFGEDDGHRLRNFQPEQDRLDFQHQMFIMALDGRLALAPMTSSPSTVLDVGTGTGIWAIQFGKPPSRHVNCEFIKTDAEDEWAFPRLPKFDYVHLRLVCMAFANPKLVLRHAWDNLTPGGWVGYRDMWPCAMSYDGSHEGTVMQQYWDALRQGLSAQGRDPTVTLQYKDWLIEAGFAEVKGIALDLPGNAWPNDYKLKRIGQYMYTDLYEDVRGAGWQLLRGMGWLPEQVEDLVARFKTDSRDEKYRVFYRMHIVYGRKPQD
ncbi:hypothetical protein LQW54_004485 [Pestalotiopsis sp. IQ-011]